jgi:hypothetical protein
MKGKGIRREVEGKGSGRGREGREKGREGKGRERERRGREAFPSHFPFPMFHPKNITLFPPFAPYSGYQ